MGLLGRKRKIGALSRRASLDSMPIRNEALREERQDDGTVVLYAKQSHKGIAKALAKLFKIADIEKRYSLDELGAYVWDMCDGETTVRTIINRFAKEYKLNRKEAEVSMVEYLKSLARKGIIGIVVPEESTERAKG